MTLTHGIPIGATVKAKSHCIARPDANVGLVCNLSQQTEPAGVQKSGGRSWVSIASLLQMNVRRALKRWDTFRIRNLIFSGL